MSDRKQPTPIDAKEYDRFVEFVRDAHGGVRGNLRTELENALREYRESYYDRDDTLVRIEHDLATVKAAVVDGDADGGAAAQSPRTHTQTDNDQHDPDDPPHPKAATKAKLDWLEAEVRRRATNQKFSRPAIRRVIEKTWGFDDRTADPMVETVVEDRLEAYSEWGDTIGWDDS